MRRNRSVCTSQFHCPVFTAAPLHALYLSCLKWLLKWRNTAHWYSPRARIPYIYTIFCLRHLPKSWASGWVFWKCIARFPWFYTWDLRLGFCFKYAPLVLKTHQCSPRCNAVSCFPLNCFEEGDKVEFLLTGCLRQIVVSSVLKTWGTHALVALCNTFSSRYKHSKWTHTMHMGLFSGNGVSLWLGRHIFRL